jgi:uroporphyrinogen decarboxylase
LSLDAPVDIAAHAAAEKDTVFIGNIDPVRVMLEGSAALVRQDAEELLAAVGSQGNFVLSSGCDLPIDTPDENIFALVEAAK